MRELENISKKWSKNNPQKSFSILLCGDFNSSPPFGVLEFMQKKIIAQNHPDWKSAEGEEVLNFKIGENILSALWDWYSIIFQNCR